MVKYFQYILLFPLQNSYSSSYISPLQQKTSRKAAIFWPNLTHQFNNESCEGIVKEKKIHSLHFLKTVEKLCASRVTIVKLYSRERRLGQRQQRLVEIYNQRSRQRGQWMENEFQEISRVKRFWINQINKMIVNVKLR